jgi:hypothetical protein
LHGSAKLIDGNAIGQAMRTDLAGEIAALKAQGVTPGLAAVLVGESPASATYVRMKGKACDEAGLYHETIDRPADITEVDLLALVDRLNADPRIHGILVQLPLPKHIDSEKVLRRVDPAKDVDGFHPMNVGKLVTGDKTAFRPATPYGVQQMLIRSGIETKGAHAVIVGRSNIVGKPMANLLIQQGPGGTRRKPSATRAPRICPARPHGRTFHRRDRQSRVRHRRDPPRHRRDDVGINRVDTPGLGLPAGGTGLRPGRGDRLRHHPGAGRRRPHDHRHVAAEHL